MLIKDLTKFSDFLKSFQKSKNQTRDRFLAEVVDKTYYEVFAAVDEFLESFLMMKRELSQLGREIEHGANNYDLTIMRLIELIDKVEDQINPGQSKRRQSFGRSVDAFEEQLFVSNVLKIFNDDEEKRAKLFFGEVCSFFSNGPRYEHEMRRSVFYARSTAERLRSQGRDRRMIEREFDDLMKFVLESEQKMLENWGRMSRYHAAISRMIREVS